MQDQNPKIVSYTSAFFTLIGFGILAIVIAAFISIPIWTAMTGKPFSAMAGRLDPADANAQKIIQLISALVGFFLPAFLAARLIVKKPFRLLGFQQRFELKQVGLVVLIMIATLFTADSLAWLTQKIPLSPSLKKSFDVLEKSYYEQIKVILGNNNLLNIISSFLLLAVVPAICEETMFRGGLQNFLSRATKNPWLAIIIISIIFSAIHFSFYGFLVRTLAGVVLGAIFYYTGSLWLSIIAHFFNNALAIGQFYVMKQQGKSLDEAVNEQSSFGFWGILALPFLILFLWRLKKASLPQTVYDQQPINNFPDGI